jgi:hypothetical protein
MRRHHRLTDPCVAMEASAPGPGRTRVAVLTLVGVALLLTACGSTSSSSTTTTSKATTTTTAPTTISTPATSTTTSSVPKSNGCATANLTITLGSPNGTAGAIHYVLTYRNAGTSACALFGYPGVSFLAAGGSQIGVPAQRTVGVGVTTVTLAPGASGYSSVTVTDPGIPPCSSQGTATQVRVYPPGETHAALAAASGGIAVCSSPNAASYQSATAGPLVSSTP